MKFKLKKSVKAQKGFTLVELSVVVLVAGLMLTAVMRGQSMLETARAQKLANDIKNIEALIGNYETAKGRLPGDCNSDGLIGVNLNDGDGTILTTLTYASTAPFQLARAILYSNSGVATTAATGVEGSIIGNELHCPAVAGTAANEANANIWVNDLRAGNFIGVNTVPRLFAKHIGEDMVFVGTWRDTLTAENYNAMTLANVPANIAQRVMFNINGSDSTTDMGQMRVFNAAASGTYLTNAFTGTTTGSVVNLVYFYRNQPRSAANVSGS
jgi:prepilin-type N-terminal cleavage/methylation domain-containing protein